MLVLTLMLMIALAGVLACRLTLGVLAQRWGVSSRTDACSWAGAMLIPLPGRTPADLVRVIGRRLPGLRYLSPSNTATAYPRIEVLVGPRSAAGLAEMYGHGVLEGEFQAMYLDLARTQGWQLPAQDVQVVIETDDRLADGRVFLEARWGPRADAAPRRSAGQGARRQTTGTTAGTTLATRLLADVDPDGTLLTEDPDTIFVSGDATVGVSPALKATVAGREHLLTGAGRHVLGRDVSCAVAVTDPSVSRQHAQVWHADDAWWLRDLSSHNGTSVDGTRLTEPVRMSGPVTVGLGACELMLAPTVVPQPARR